MATQISLYDETAKLKPLLALAKRHPNLFDITVLPGNQELRDFDIKSLSALLVDPMNIVVVGFSTDGGGTKDVLTFGLRHYVSKIYNEQHFAYVEYEKEEIENYARSLFRASCTLENNMDRFVQNIARQV